MDTIRPRLGPRSGGSLLTLTGAHLDTGSNVTVTLSGLPCRVTSRHAAVMCVTAPAPEGTAVSQVTVRVDAAERTLSVPFTYVDGESPPTVLQGISKCNCTAHFRHEIKDLPTPLAASP